MESAESEFLTIYDSHWFEMELFRSTTSSSSDSPPDSPTLASMYLQIQNQKQQQPPPPLGRPNRGGLRRSTMIRSISDDVYSKPTFESGGSDSPDSPDSVLPPPPEQRKPRKKGDKNKNKIEGSKSLTALEIEELKGFMDLGFVFSEKDTDFSRLVSILPGLQKLGKTEEEEEKGRKKIVKKKPLMNLRVSIGSDVELKDSLRMWAHSVASTVR
ncbi:hypothetical protein LINGRAHAP2_LOCUS26591 [Linum grandiflorum]